MGRGYCMKRYYYGINEVQLNTLLEKGELKFSNDYLKSISSTILHDNFNQAVSQSTRNVYLNKANKIVILELVFVDDISEHFYLRINKRIKLENVIGYYIGERVTKNHIYQLEASVELYLDYENILNEEFIGSLTCADEDDIYNRINLDGIELININTVMNKDSLDKFINETFAFIEKSDNYNYIKVS